jgi:hypothetical protein
MSSSVFNITPNCIKAVSLGSTESYNALRPYNSPVVLGLNDVGYGSTTELGFWNGKTPPSDGYTVYISGQPTASTIVTKTFIDDAELIMFANQEGISATTIYEAVSGLIALGYLVMNYNLPDFPLNSNIIFSVFSGVAQSLPNYASGLTNQWNCMGSAAFTTFNNFFTINTTYIDLDGSAVLFNGDQSFSIDSPANIPIENSDYTIVVWFNTSDNAGGAQGLVGWGNYGTNDQVNAFRLDNDNLINYWWGDDLTVIARIENNTWYCAIATYDSAINTRSIFLNGVLLNYDNPTGTHNVTTASNITIGYTGLGSNYFNGKIQNVAVYNKAFNVKNARDYYYSTLPLIGGVSTSFKLLTNPSFFDLITESGNYINIQN